MSCLASLVFASHGIKLHRFYFIRWLNKQNIHQIRLSWANVIIARYPEQYFLRKFQSLSVYIQFIDKEAVEKRLYVLQKQGHNIYTKTNDLFT